MGPLTSTEATLLTIIMSLVASILGLGGIAIGKILGARGAQTASACALAQTACKSLLLEKILSLDQRLERIETKVDIINSRKKL